ncbi:MAG: hypothetical protein HQK54_14095, partial [Oligoflexales bacterium]|nr:hypothetical protein [Oligoflexales bacterium]
GSYVVADRFSIGPSYLKPFAEIAELPINLGIDSKINILQMYMRSDGRRLANSHTLPLWRSLINNWFGLLPFITEILPPSFNPNELYDPLQQAKTPFIFPANKEIFEKMEIGSIISYSISGGIQIGLDMVSNKILERIPSSLSEDGKLNLGIPYAIFLKGENRINVLRKSKNIAWVGLTNAEKFGHGIAARIGKLFFIYKKTLSLFNNVPLLEKLPPMPVRVPAMVLPVNIEGELAKMLEFDQLYSFDLNNNQAEKAYNYAVGGDFTVAKEYSLKEAETGVKFLFKKSSESKISSVDRSRNLFVQYNNKASQHEKAEIRGEDEKGKFFVLESKLKFEDKNWNILVGENSTNFFYRTEINVFKKKADTQKGWKYEIDEGTANPYSILMSMNISSKYVDTIQFRSYIDNLEKFTKLSLEDIPYIPVRENDELIRRRRNSALIDPMEEVKNIHVVPSHLGKMVVDAAVFFSRGIIDRILERTEDDIWSAFENAFEMEDIGWNKEMNRESLFNKFRWIPYYVSYPLKVLNVNFTGPAAINEASSFVEAVKYLKNSSEPLEKLEGFHRLINTSCPVHLARVLLILADVNKVPRSISFSTSISGIKNKSKLDFLSINQKIVKSDSGFSELNYRMNSELLNAFEPTQMKEVSEKPTIRKLKIKMKSSSNETSLKKHVLLGIFLDEVPGNRTINVFVKIEQGGRVNFGRFVLSEKVISLDLKEVVKFEKDKKEKYYYEFFLSGPESPLRNYMFDKMIEFGGLLDVSVSVSVDGEVWSQKRKISFRLEEDKIYAPKE